MLTANIYEKRQRRDLGTRRVLPRVSWNAYGPGDQVDEGWIRIPLVGVCFGQSMARRMGLKGFLGCDCLEVDPRHY